MRTSSKWHDRYDHIIFDNKCAEGTVCIGVAGGDLPSDWDGGWLLERPCDQGSTVDGPALLPNSREEFYSAAHEMEQDSTQANWLQSSKALGKIQQLEVLYNANPLAANRLFPQTHLACIAMTFDEASCCFQLTCRKDSKDKSILAESVLLNWKENEEKLTIGVAIDCEAGNIHFEVQHNQVSWCSWSRSLGDGSFFPVSSIWGVNCFCQHNLGQHSFKLLKQPAAFPSINIPRASFKPYQAFLAGDPAHVVAAVEGNWKVCKVLLDTRHVGINDLDSAQSGSLLRHFLKHNDKAAIDWLLEQKTFEQWEDMDDSMDDDTWGEHALSPFLQNWTELEVFKLLHRLLKEHLLEGGVGALLAAVMKLEPSDRRSRLLTELEQQCTRILSHNGRLLPLVPAELWLSPELRAQVQHT